MATPAPNPKSQQSRDNATGVTLNQLLHPTGAASSTEFAGLKDTVFWSGLLGHELNSPLQSIVGLLELTQHSSLQPSQRHWLELAEQSARQMQRFVQEMLTCVEASHASQRQSLPAGEAFELRAFLLDFCQQFRHAARAKGNHIHLQVEPTVPNYWRGNPTLIRHLLANLVSNAIKFTEEGYVKVKVSAEPAEADSTSQWTLKLEVQDTGCGFSLEGLRHHFNPLPGQPDKEGALPASRGFGLGLYLVNTVTRALNGEVTVNSSPGQGSTFQVRLPMALQEAMTPEALKGMSLVFLTPKDCECDDDHRDSLNPLGVAKHLVTYDRVPPAIASLRQLVNEDDFIYLCTQHLSSDEAFEWLEAPGLAEQKKPLLIVAGEEDDFIERFERFRQQYPAPCLLVSSSLDFAPAFRAILDWQAQWKTPALPETNTDTLGPMKILLVENNPVHRMITEAHLLQQGHQVISHSRMEEALSFIQREDVDVVLSDLFLEDGQGIELARTLRRWERQGKLAAEQSLFIAALTACESKLEEHWALQAGMNAYFTKPLDLPKLNEAVTRFRAPAPLGSNALATEGHGVVLPTASSLSAHELQHLGQFNQAALLSMLNHNEALMAQVLDALQEDIPVHLATVEQALSKRDFVLVAKEAHQMKGSFAYIHAAGLKQVADKLETAAAEEAQGTSLELFGKLKSGFQQLQSTLAPLVTSTKTMPPVSASSISA